MNILYLHTHDTGRYIEPYGYNVPTPNLMNLAKEGTLFRNAYCAGPTCSPSRGALLSGMTPHSNGLIGLTHRGFRMKDYNKHLVHILNNNNYETVLCGIQHEAQNIEELGYEINLSTENKYTTENRYKWDLDNAKEVVKYIKEKKSKPFFLSFGMINTHREFPPLGDVNPNYVMPAFPIADSKKTREDMARYISSAKIADECVGEVLKALRDSGEEENTLIIFTTDHGIAFPRMKCHLYDTGIGVSLIFKYKNNKMSGQVVDALVSQIDVFPTLCEMLNIDKPSWLQGISFFSILEKEKTIIRDEIFSEVTFHATYEPIRCVRTNRYKLIKYFDSSDIMIRCNTDDGESRRFLADTGFYQERLEKEMLFDLYKDPVERVNLVNNDEYKAIYKNMSDKLYGWMLETNDPLLNGIIEPPEGAIVDKN